MQQLDKFHSQFERRLYAAVVGAGQDAAYETMHLPYTISHVYTPDFILPSGVVCEATGYMPASKRQKLLAVQAAYPHLDIRIVFQNASNRLNSRSPTTYGEWASRHGFVWCQGNIPMSWFDTPPAPATAPLGSSLV